MLGKIFKYYLVWQAVKQVRKVLSTPASASARRRRLPEK